MFQDIPGPILRGELDYDVSLSIRATVIRFLLVQMIWRVHVKTAQIWILKLNFLMFHQNMGLIELHHESEEFLARAEALSRRVSFCSWGKGINEAS